MKRKYLAIESFSCSFKPALIPTIAQEHQETIITTVVGSMLVGVDQGILPEVQIPMMPSSDEDAVFVYDE